MRIVLDTNVVFSALLWRGTPYRLRSAARRHERIQLFTSATLILELTQVLLRPAAKRRLDALGAHVETVLLHYVQATHMVTPVPVPPITADVDDDHVIATALAAQADLLISGDGDLLVLGSYQGIEIVTPAKGLALIEAAPYLN